MSIFKHNVSIFSVAGLALIPVLSLGLPAASHAATIDQLTSQSPASSYSYAVDHAQTLTVSPQGLPQTISRDMVTVTSAPAVEAPTGRTAVSGWNGTVDTSNILSIARSFIGQVPYVSGGSSPDTGFDCSGFTQYVYGLAGISLPHSSTSQGAMGQEVPFSEAREGDLLIWPGHAAIYAGGGMIVDASVPGTMISEHPIWGSPRVVRI